MSIKEALFTGITKSASRKIHIEYAMSRLNNSEPDFTWIKDDIDCLLERFGATFNEYESWLRQNSKIDIRIIF